MSLEERRRARRLQMSAAPAQWSEQLTPDSRRQTVRGFESQSMPLVDVGETTVGDAHGMPKRPHRRSSSADGVRQLSRADCVLDGEGAEAQCRQWLAASGRMPGARAVALAAGAALALEQPFVMLASGGDAAEMAEPSTGDRSRAEMDVAFVVPEVFRAGNVEGARARAGSAISARPDAASTRELGADSKKCNDVSALSSRCMAFDETCRLALQMGTSARG